MKEYEFTLIFALEDSTEDPSNYEEALESNECTDALVGIGRKGSIALMFDREATSAKEAIVSAIAAVRKSIPNSVLTEAQPDLIGITDIAKLVDKSRQNIRKLIYAEGSECPLPVHSGNPALWHLHDILIWLQQAKGYNIDQDLIQVSKITKGLNALRTWTQVESDIQKQAEIMIAIEQKSLVAASL